MGDPDVIYPLKDLAHFLINLLVDFLHEQYIDFMDFMPYWRQNKTRTKNTASPQYHGKKNKIFHLDWLSAESTDSLHGREGGLLFDLVAKADEAESLARTSLVQDH
jgi:hypothetical protein